MPARRVAEPRTAWAGLLFLLLGGCAATVMTGYGGGRAPAEDAEAVRADQRISARVIEALVEARDVPAFDIRVSTRRGVVRLTGRVPSARARTHAVLLARGADGVVDVIDELRIVSPRGD